MSEFIDLTGRKFNKLTVVRRDKTVSGGIVYWECKCDCGNTTIVRGGNLKSGVVKSCGCLRYVPKTMTHGSSKTRLYTIWAGIKDRCKGTCSQYTKKIYHDRGIRMCEEWEKSFEVFKKWAYDNGYNDELTIERIDNDRGYEPSNCTWIPKSEQSNNRRNCRRYTYNGKTQNLMQWCVELGVEYKLAHNRINKLHWDFEKAVFTPCQKIYHNKKGGNECVRI